MNGAGIGLRATSAAALGTAIAGTILVAGAIATGPGPGAPAVAIEIAAAFVLGAAGTWLLVAGRIREVADALASGDEQATPVAIRPSRLPVLGRLIDAANAATSMAQVTREAATTDRLTQVANRAALLARLGLEVQRATRYGRALSVAFVDIDHFKRINDTYGHPVGDLVLREVARVLAANVRASDTVGRYGGEEFMILLPESPADEAADAVEKLRRLVMRARVTPPGHEALSVTVSIGVAGAVGRELEAEALIRDADAAMYSAKSLGRNQVFRFAVPHDDRALIRPPVAPGMQALGRGLGRAAGEAAESSLREALRGLGPRAEPGSHAVAAAVGVAKALGLLEAEVDRIRTAAMFHDAGMAAVPDDVLDRPRALRADERNLVTQHPRVSELMLREAGRLRDAAEIVLHHHERFAGHGYPHGLRGTEIPLGARVLAVADAYQAMREERPYRPAFSHAQAVRELQRLAGTQFDPEVVAVFVRLYQEAPPDENRAPIPALPDRIAG